MKAARMLPCTAQGALAAVQLPQPQTLKAMPNLTKRHHRQPHQLNNSGPEHHQPPPPKSRGKPASCTTARSYIHHPLDPSEFLTPRDRRKRVSFATPSSLTHMDLGRRGNSTALHSSRTASAASLPGIPMLAGMYRSQLYCQFVGQIPAGSRVPEGRMWETALAMVC